jgi:uncharacterized membrane protein HdeD (DUF308 family)
MSGSPFNVAASVRSNSGWVLALGIIQIIVGILAFSFSFSATIASVVTLGMVLMIAGGAQTGAAFLTRDWGGFFLYLLLGVVYAVAGFLTLQYPLQAAEGLTLMLAAGFLVGGTFRILIALVERFDSWGWVLVNGVITTLLGFAICRQFPGSSLWVLGAFVGIELMVNGVTWSILATGVRKALQPFAGK